MILHRHTPRSRSRPGLTRSAAPRAALLVTALVLGAAGAAPAASPTFTVRYRSASNVYLDGGKAEGLSVGDRLAVTVGTETVAELEVVYIAEGSASCRIVTEKRAVRPGDVATLAKRAPEPVAEVQEAPRAAPPTVIVQQPATARTPPKTPWARVRGYASAGLYKVWDADGVPGFDQRSARLDLSLYEIAGQPLSLNTRFRSRRDQRSLSLGSTRLTRRNDLYEMSLRYEPTSDNLAFEVGRLGSARFSSVGYLDGGLIRLRLASPLQVGGFFGRRSDIEGLGPDASGQKYGYFLRLSPRNPYSAAYDVFVAFVREFSQSDVSREFVGVESRFGSGWFSLFERAEIDLNRGWRRDLAEEDYQISNLSVAANMRFSRSASAVLSYDSLRNYRDYLTRAVPEQIFDDLLHQGLRASVYLGSGYGLNATAGFGMRFQENGLSTPVGSANSYNYNAGLRHGNLFAQDISLGADLNAFRNDATSGYLLTAQTGKRFRQGHQIELSHGRSRYLVRDTGQERRTEYLRFTGRSDLGRHVYLLMDLEYDRGDDLRGPRGFFEIGYRF
jgi:hypothetical protein